MKIHSFLAKTCLFTLLLALSYSPTPAQETSSPAFVKVLVPEEAKLEVDGKLTNYKGSLRQFITPNLKTGTQYCYIFKVTYLVNGKETTVTKEVFVEAGKEIDLDLRSVATKESPKKTEEPKKVENKVEVPKKAELKKTEEPKKIEIKKEEPKKIEVKKAEPQKVEIKEEPKKPEFKKEEPKAEPKKELTEEEPKQEKTIVVPYVSTPQVVVNEMLKLAGVKEGEVVYDLGCGDGRIVITAVKDFKAKRGLGIDLNPERVKESIENAKKAGIEKQVEFKEGDVLKLTDLSEANVVTLYLLPEVNRRLMPVLKKTLKPGSRVVSHDFSMDTWAPEKEIEVQDNDGGTHTLFLWTIKESDNKNPMSNNDSGKPLNLQDMLVLEQEQKAETKKEDKTIVVPYVPTPQIVVDEMLKLANVKEGEVVYDLGCGDGRIVITAVKKFKAKKGFGLDLNPERVKDSIDNAKKNGVEKQVEFKEGDVLKLTDLSEANVVTLYLLPEVNRLLKPVLLKTLKPGSRIVSHDFDMGDWKAEKEIKVTDEDGIGHTIYLWTIPEAKKK